MDLNRNSTALWPQAGPILQRSRAHAQRRQEVMPLQENLSERRDICWNSDAAFFVRSHIACLLHLWA
jgi:hypothetical protein